MKQVIFLLALIFMNVWARPNFDKFAHVYGKEFSTNKYWVKGYIDGEGKLWMISMKWHTKKVASDGGSPALLPNGSIIPPPPTQYSEMPTVPYLYFLLLDNDGNVINEGPLGDSAESSYIVPIKNGGSFVISRISIDLINSPGYLHLIVINKNGVIEQQQKLLESYLKNRFVDEIVLDDEGKIYITFANQTQVARVYVKNGLMDFHDDVKWLNPPTTRRETYLLEMLNDTVPFAWTKVDTFHDQINYDSKSYVLFKDKIQIPHFDTDLRKWIKKRYNVPNSSIRKFKDFDLFQLKSYSVKDMPEIQSVRLNNGNIVVTILMKENNRSVAYQMLFDSLGKYIAPEKMEIKKPKDIKKIPDGSKMYIKGTHVYHSDKPKTTEVYIWGYDREDGMLYWKKYHVD